MHTKQEGSCYQDVGTTTYQLEEKHLPVFIYFELSQQNPDPRNKSGEVRHIQETPRIELPLITPKLPQGNQQRTPFTSGSLTPDSEGWKGVKLFDAIKSTSPTKRQKKWLTREIGETLEHPVLDCQLTR